MRYFLLSGEPSGDLHGSNLIRSLLEKDPGAEIACWGGEMMYEAGARLLKHYRETAFMGAWEVLINLRTVISNFKTCRKHIMEFKPDVVIMIDYPGFNLRVARYVKKQGIKVFYYISPKFWAWKEGRVRLVKKYVDRMYIIFPFEVDFYKKHGYQACFLGNPLIDHIENARKNAGTAASVKESLGLDERPVIALLSGSRHQEVKYVLPEMVKVAACYPDYQFVVASVSHLPESMYSDIIGTIPVKMVKGRTYDLLSVSEAALVTSGTATLETALFGVPQIVCYKTSQVTYNLAMLFLKVRFISLVNLIMDKEIVRELVQKNLNQVNLNRELADILTSGYKHNIVLNDYSTLKILLGGGGASARIAMDISENLRANS